MKGGDGQHMGDTASFHVMKKPPTLKLCSTMGFMMIEY